MTRRLAADLFQDDPITQPLTYPGRIPDSSGILIDDDFLRLRPVSGGSPEYWLTEPEDTPATLVSILEQLESPPVSARIPVIAVGSNAAPSQMLRKLTRRSVRPVLPMTLADISGIAAGVSAHVSAPGYIPAVPVEAPGEVARLFVLWLDSEQLKALDATEPNYWRRELPADQFPVQLVSGHSIPKCFIYVGRHGCLVNREGLPLRLTSQRALIENLLTESPALRELCGTTADEFTVSVHHEDVRRTVRQLFINEKRTQRQPGLEEAAGACPATPARED